MERNAQAWLSAIVESTDDAILSKTLDGVITSWNASAERIFGYTAAEAIGQKMLMLFPPERLDEERDILERISRGERVEHLQTVRVRKDGRRIDVSVTTSPIKDAAGTIIGASKIARDITLAVARERELARISRLYAALSQVNQAIVWTPRRDELMQKICRVLVEFGGFRMAWIGWRRDGSGGLDRVAEWGDDLDLLARLSDQTDGDANAEGPATLAMREGRPYICNDVGSDAFSLRWRDTALSRGVRAIAAFPIRVEGAVQGALTVYADDVFVFREKEVALLAEAALDTSFGLDNRRREDAKRQMEEARAATEGRYRTLFEHAPDGIIIANAAGVYLDVNPSLCEMLGRTRDELVGRTAEDIVVPTEVPHITPALEAITGDAPYAREWRFRRGDGGIFTADVIATMMPDGNILALVRGTGDRHRAEATLRESEQRFRQLAENVSEVFWITDARTQQVLYVSPAYERIWDRPCDALYTEPSTWLDAVHEDDRERIAVAARTKQRAGTYDETYRIVRPDGELRWIRDRAFPVADERGDTYRVVGTAQDVTDRQRLEEQFLRAQRMESVGRLASGIAHDLNNVLSPIMMSIELLDSEPKGPDRISLIETVRTSAQRGADLIKQVLLFSRGMDGARVPVMPLPLMSELVAVMRETIPRSISVKLEPAQDLWLIQGDPTQLHQVFLNLLVNARDAMHGGGKLTVAIENVTVGETADPMAFDSRPGDFVKITISDTGVGIPPEHRHQIFEPFFTTKELGIGTGLGLSTTVGLVKSHGGFISLRSAIGKGSAFAVYLPAIKEAQPSSEPAAAAPLAPARGNGELILLVDDEELIRMVARHALEQAGYRVIEASHGAEAVSIYAGRMHEIAVVLTDMTMPVMGGSALAIALRAINPKAKIVVSSGLGEAGESNHGPHVSKFLPKPYSSEMMLRALQETLATN